MPPSILGQSEKCSDSEDISLLWLSRHEILILFLHAIIRHTKNGMHEIQNQEADYNTSRIYILRIGALLNYTAFTSRYIFSYI